MARVLIVDDNAEVRMLLQALLQSAGHEVLEAADGSEVSYWALRAQPDLILLDVMMPSVDGWEALRELKADDRVADIPVIMVTARKGIDDMDRAEELGAADYVAKPWSQQELDTRIKWALRKKRNPAIGEPFGPPAGFLPCGCPAGPGETEETHRVPEDCFGGQQTEWADAV